MRYLLLFESHSELEGDFSFLRKEPKYLPLFNKLLKDKEENRTTLEGLKVLYSQIQAHRNTLKQYNIDILSAKTLEDVDDMLTKAMWIEKYNKFTKLLPLNLRKEIRGSKELSKKFREYINDFDYEEYKNIFLTKVVKYRSPEQLFDAMDKYLAGNIEKRQLIKEINEDPGIRVYSDKDNVLVAMVYSKKSSCSLGSSQWCISNNSYNYWDSYVPDKEGVQYFIWDFNKKGTDPLSKIGVTIYSDGSYVAHDKSDKAISFSIIPIPKIDLKNYKEISEDDQEMMMIFNKYLLKKGKNIKISLKETNTRFAKKLLKYNSDLFFELIIDSKDLDFLTDDELIEYATNDNKLLINPYVYNRISNHIYPIINNDHSLSNLYKILEKNPFLDLGLVMNNMNKIVDNLTEIQKDELISKDITLLRFDHFTDRIDKEKLGSYIDDFPELIFHNSMKGKLSMDKYKELCVKFPEIYYRIKNIVKDTIKISKDEYKTMIHRLFERFNEGKYTDNWGSGNYDSVNLWNTFPKLDYLDDDKFIYSLFNDKEHISRMLRCLPNLLIKLPLSYVNRLYWKHKGEIKNIISSDLNYVKDFNKIKSYYSNEETLKKFDNNDLYVFNARYKNEKVGENPRSGKPIYEEVLSIENILLYIPFITNIQPMKMRAMVQGDLNTYGLWVDRDLLSSYSKDGGHTINPSDLDDYIIDLLDKHKFRI